MPRKKKEDETPTRTGKAGAKKTTKEKNYPVKSKTAPRQPARAAPPEPKTARKTREASAPKSSSQKIAKKVTPTAGAGKMKKETSRTGRIDEKKRVDTPPRVARATKEEPPVTREPKKAPPAKVKNEPEKVQVAPPAAKPLRPAPSAETGQRPPERRPTSVTAPGKPASVTAPDRSVEIPAGPARRESDVPRETPRPHQLLEEIPPLPEGYGETRIVLMPIDPDWVHSYWEVTGASLDEARRTMGQYFEGAERALRVRRIDESQAGHTLDQFFVDIGDQARSWYIKVPQPDCTYQADLGLRSSRGDFYVLATSNPLRVARRGMSDVIDEKWTNPAHGYFEKIYALSGGFQVGMGSLELQQRMEELMQGDISSGAVGSFAMGSGMLGVQKKERVFWLRVGAELIVYGATDSRAQVTLLGKPVQLRPDGTFSARFALPDGLRDIPITALSPDGIEEREIDITVTRETLEKEPVLK
jgi:hypothetical protein